MEGNLSWCLWVFCMWIYNVFDLSCGLAMTILLKDHVNLWVEALCGM